MRYNGGMSIKNEKTVKAVAYARISTLLNQDPETQLIRIRDFAQARKFDLVQEFVDRGISGVTERRKELDRLVAEARRGAFDVIIVSAIDRLGRSTKHLLNLMEELRHYGVSLISLRENLDFSTPTGAMCLTMISAVSAIERDLISERIKTSMAAKKLATERNGGAWRCGRPVRVTPEVVQKVIDLHAKGLSVRKIAQALGQEISRGSVQRIIKGYR